MLNNEDFDVVLINSIGSILILKWLLERQELSHGQTTNILEIWSISINLIRLIIRYMIGSEIYHYKFFFYFFVTILFFHFIFLERMNFPLFSYEIKGVFLFCKKRITNWYRNMLLDISSEIQNLFIRVIRFISIIKFYF